MTHFKHSAGLAILGGVMIAVSSHAQTPADAELPINDPDDIVALCGGDPDAGLPNFVASCAACHTLNEGEPHLEGANLYALYGRTAGSAEGFDCSPAMAQAGADGLVWGRETLQSYLEDAQAVVPESIHPPLPEMVDTTYRTDLMTYVRLTTTPPPPAPEDMVVPDDVLAMEGDVAYGEYLGSACLSCQVANGAANGDIPAIHVLPRDYLVLPLYQYRVGARDNSTMVNVAARLSDEEIVALAAYFATQ